MRAANRRQSRRFAAFSVVCAAGIAAASLAHGQAPPQPDFFWSYGTVTIGVGNVDPPVQPVLALVNGRVCGEGVTTVATADPDNPPSDVGKTVYVIDVLADGTASGQRAGCGRAGDQILFYFPALGRIAAERPTFSAGGRRVNLSLNGAPTTQLRLPMASADGAP